jgi:hypothetical protein
MRCLSRGLGAIVEAGKYTCATVEYTGLVSYGALKFGGRVVAHSFRIVTAPVARGMAIPFVGIKKVTLKVFGRKNYFDEKFESVEEKLARIAERLASIENRGIVVRGTAVPTKVPRRIDLGRQALLRQIVEANKSLIDG